MGPLESVRLPPLMQLSLGRPEVQIGLIDGPVALDHPDLAVESIRLSSSGTSGGCTSAGSLACEHGTFVAGILAARRTSSAPAICPDCTLLVRPIFAEFVEGSQDLDARPEDLAGAIVEVVDMGARVLNLSVALVQSSTRGRRALDEALDHAASRGAITVAATGNQGMIGATGLASHPYTIPVVACDERGGPMGFSNLGRSIGLRGLGAPGVAVRSLGSGGTVTTAGGTSVAAPFVTGTIALLWSMFPDATASEVRFALIGLQAPRRARVVPPLLDAWAAYQAMARGRA